MSFDEIIDRRHTGSGKWDAAPGPIDPDRHIIPLSVADMEFRSPPAIRERLVQLAQEGVWGYTGPRPQYFEALDRWYRLRHNFPIQKDWVIPTTGVVQAVYAAVRAFSREGEGVLIQTPVYHPFYRAIEGNDRRLLENPLVIRQGRYEIDFEDLEAKMKEARLFILCNPHNPVGRVWDRDELDRMAQLAAQYGVFVISDEIHCDFTYGKDHIVFSHLARDRACRHLLAFSASKTFSLAGLNLASMVLEDPEDRDHYVKQVRRDGVNTHSSFGFAAAEAAYTLCDDWYFAMLDYIQANYQALKNFAAQEMPKLHVFDLEGTYLAWLDFRAVCQDPETLETYLNEAYLYFNQGSMFGNDGQGFERINLACPRSLLMTSLQRLKTVYDRLVSGADR
ncbi:MAG TPA: MalY/PatB family protein [Clostridia bacterium]|nr:MalY/PatB family protein [Clostridia bacterium]